MDPFPNYFRLLLVAALSTSGLETRFKQRGGLREIPKEISRARYP